MGLSLAEAEARLRRDGPNTLPVAPGVPAWRQFMGKLVHFFALMLWVAGGLAWVAGLPELSVAIVLVVLVNAAFAFAQEYRAELAAERLRDLLPRRSTVVRGGRRLAVDSSELVVGDRLVLEAGDRVSADLRLEVAHNLWVDTSSLTGESVPTAVDSGDTIFAGTFITEGEGSAAVVATGARTRLAGIARLAQASPRPQPPLARELRRVVRTIAFIAIGVGVIFFGAALLLGTPLAQGFIFAIGVTVALVPEALLPTVTLSLAMAAQRMAARHALVRRLESVQTLGSTTFICTDKTGTLTRNEMSAVEVWTPAGTATVVGEGYEPVGQVLAADSDTLAAVEEVALVAARCSSGHVELRDGLWVAVGDPMEAAIEVLARRIGNRGEEDQVRTPERQRFPFDPHRRRMSIVTTDQVMVKGAPDSVFPACRDWRQAEVPLERMTARGLRVLAVAARGRVNDSEPTTSEEAEHDLSLLGLLGFEDPPRLGAAEAVRMCRRAGIAVAMVTGDHPLTALTVAQQVGIAGLDARVVTGDRLPADDLALGELVDRDGIVLARIEPEDKLRIARALRARGHVLAMTGDGVNDGPALKEADIGVAMGRSGTDVAREAADLVLLDDDFATIVAAVEQGRAVFANAQRFLTYHLTDNVAELTPFLVTVLSGGRIPLALGVLQILALDIGTDTLSAVALGAEPAEKGVIAGRPPRTRLLDRSVLFRAFGILGPVEAVMGMAAFFGSFVAFGWRPGLPFPSGQALLTASGATFAAIVVAQTANAFACRSATKWPGALGWFSNRLLVTGSSIELVIAAGCLLIPPLAMALGHALPSLVGWGIAVLAGPAVLLVDAANKSWRARGSHRTLGDR